MSRPLFELGDGVRLIRNVRNDGTYPGMKVGDLLIRRGSIGHVRDIGTFLQDQIIYKVHFLQEGRVVGCREEELIPETAPWTPSRFESRERVMAAKGLSVNGNIVVASGAEGEVIKVLRNDDAGVSYHVLFDARVLRVPETALTEI